MEAFNPHNPNSTQNQSKKERKEKHKELKEAEKLRSKKNKNKNNSFPEPKPLRIKMKPTLAIDCGNVISITDTDCGGGSLYQKVMRGVVTPECIAGVRTLVTHFGVENTYVLSKCGTNMQQGTIIMLTRNNFFEETGMSLNNVIFCTDRKGGKFTRWQNLEAPEDWPHVKPDDLKNFRPDGPRVASGKVGKGVIGKELGMTCLIDDRIDCHESFHEEGANSDDMRLVHFAETDNSKKHPIITLGTNNWEEVVQCLIAKPPAASDLIDNSEIQDPLEEVMKEED